MPSSTDLSPPSNPAKARIQELSKRIRALESDLQMNQGRIDKSQEKLRAVKTNKEYQSGLKEIEDLRRHRIQNRRRDPGRHGAGGSGERCGQGASGSAGCAGRL
ncbi:MAG: tropomyosin [Desulfobacterales bacterium]|nr:tropomyosin [Desulfobacterales bacterium]